MKYGNQSGKRSIAILGTRGIPAQYGGFETFAERLSLGLAEQGIDVTVFCEAGESAQPERLGSVRLVYVSAPALGPLKTILYDVKCLWAARKGFDVVYMLGYGAAPFCVIPQWANTEVWINPDGVEWARAKWGFAARSYFRLMEWLCMRTANRVIADANAVAEFLIRRHGRRSKCVVIPYGCDLIELPPSVELLSQWGLQPEGYYLVVCRLEPENHVMEMLEAFQQCSSGKQLVVVGNHMAKTKYIEQLRKVNDPRIRMIGAVYDQVKLSALRFYSFAYLHGHSVGGTNPSLLEAMGCGNLIFAHDNPFNRETLGAFGFYFKTAEDLTGAIDNAELNCSNLDELRQGARQRAMSSYSWPSIIARYIELLEAKGTS